MVVQVDNNKYINQHPFFGKTSRLVERIHSLDEKWYVEVWENHYYFLGIEVFASKNEVVRRNGQEFDSKNATA